MVMMSATAVVMAPVMAMIMGSFGQWGLVLVGLLHGFNHATTQTATRHASSFRLKNDELVMSVPHPEAYVPCSQSNL